MTAGTEAEQWLNRNYGPDSELYETLASIIRAGVADGWAANIEVGGPKYRRSRICSSPAETLYFSITAVYMDSTGNVQHNPRKQLSRRLPRPPLRRVQPGGSARRGAALAGPNGWCHAGWTAPAPGSHHYPEAKDGAVIALFYLPAGRISYDITSPSENGTDAGEGAAASSVIAR